MNINADHTLRLKAFDSLLKLKQNSIPRKTIIDEIHREFGVPKGTLYDWHAERHRSWGRKGKITPCPELYYVIGALLGDGCLYRWKPTNNYTMLIGDINFTTKYAKMLEHCIDQRVKPYIDRSKNIWFVKTNNFELYQIFKKSREDLNHLENMMLNKGRKCSLLFVEGFFDAEGCVKIINDKARKTPKICLDITNTDYDILEVVRKILERELGIIARYSVQKGEIGKDGHRRKTSYHLRIYKKDFVRKFF